jgi:hypothetical protein
VVDTPASDVVAERALELAGSGDAPVDVEAAVAELISVAGGDRAALEAARNRLARRLLGRAGDWQAAAALGLLNKALVSAGWRDPYDWKVRWSQRFRRP